MGANTNAATNIILQDNIFYAAGWQESQHNLNGQYGGMQFNGRCTSGCVFQRNISHSNSSWGMSLIEGVSNATVANNLIFNNGGHGIVMQIYPGACTITGTSTEGGTICPYDTNNNLFVNNTIWLGKYRADGANSGSVYPQVFAGFDIANNLDTSGPGSLCVEGGVAVAGANCTMEQTFRNNIVVTYDGQTFRFDQAATDKWLENSKFDHNLIYHLGAGATATRYTAASGTQTTYSFAQFESTYAGTDLGADPLFIRANPAEYASAGLFSLRLQSGSPARGFGATTSAPAVDLTRDARTSPPDDGAYQYNATATGVTTTGDGSTTGGTTTPTPPSNLRLVAYSTQTSTQTTSTQTDPANADIVWTQQAIPPGGPAFNGWLTLLYDGVSRQILHYGVVSGSMSIYSSDMFAYSSATNNWSHIGGNGSLSSTCPASTDSWPGDRHPYGQMTIDARRNVLWLFGGVCSGTIRQDMYYMTLNAVPTSNQWHRVAIRTIPAAAMTATMVYVPDDDLIFLFGSDGSAQTHDHWVYCPTNLNPTPGALTARQSAAGCTRADDWTEVLPANGIQPPGVSYPGLAYDPATKKVIQFGGTTGGGIAQNDTWAYDVPTRTWTRKALSATPPPVFAGSSSPQPAMAYNSLTGRILFRQTTNAGAPADWQYDPIADTWTKLASAGGGPAANVYMAYDAANQRFVTFSQGSGGAEVWQAVVK
jgi:hypothetical protein